MKLSLVIVALVSVILLGGCPNTTQPDPTVSAVISADVTSINPGDTVTFDASGSTSKNAGTLTYAWNFGGDGNGDTVSATHEFKDPGRYTVTLTVTDATGATGTSSVDIRVRGGAPTARIVADQTSGKAVLTVKFDGTTSTTPDTDDICDYLWDFGDGQASTDAKPVYKFTVPGTYTVKLTVTTCGGVEGQASVTITVEGSPTHSLQFDGGQQVALLALGGSQTLADLTFEAWVSPTATGGTVVSTLEGGLTLQVLPSTNQVVYTMGSASGGASVTGLANSWHHVALTRQATGRTKLYVDGGEKHSTPTAGPVSASQFDLGMEFSGNIAEVRFWTEARSASEIQANMNQRLSSPASESNLLGYWKIDEDGASQFLQNLGTSGYSGLLGTSQYIDAQDPTWSTDGPQLDG